MTLTEAGPGPAQPEKERQLPPPEGVRIIGEIDPTKLGEATMRSDYLYLKMGAPIPPNLEPVSDVIRLAWSRNPDHHKNFSIIVDNQPYNQRIGDPFKSVVLNSTSSQSKNGKAHKDSQSTIIATDNNTTICYPTGADGEPDMERGWQARPGQIIEFDMDVWHSPPYEAEGEGIRNVVIVYPSQYS